MLFRYSHKQARLSATSSIVQSSHPVDSADKPEEKSSESKEPAKEDGDKKLPVVKEDTTTGDKAPTTDEEDSNSIPSS